MSIGIAVAVVITAFLVGRWHAMPREQKALGYPIREAHRMLDLAEEDLGWPGVGTFRPAVLSTIRSAAFINENRQTRIDPRILTVRAINHAAIRELLSWPLNIYRGMPSLTGQWLIQTATQASRYLVEHGDRTEALHEEEMPDRRARLKGVG